MPEFQGKAALHLSISGGAVCMAIPQVQKSGAAGPRQKRGTWASPAVWEGLGVCGSTGCPHQAVGSCVVSFKIKANAFL